MRKKLLLLIALPFAVSLALLALVAISTRETAESFDEALRWSQHLSALHDVETDAEHVLGEAYWGDRALDAAITDLEGSLARSRAQAVDFSSTETAEEDHLHGLLDEIATRARVFAGQPVQMAGLRADYRARVEPEIHRRVRAEQAGAQATADTSHARASQWAIGATAGALLLLAFGLWWGLHTARRITRAVDVLRAQAARIASGDLSTTVAVDTRDELAHLAHAFNAMAADLRGTMVHRDELAAQVEARSRALLETEDQLRQAQKLDAIGRLAGGVAHDFNNLLTVILANTELVTDALGPDHVASADVAEIRAAAERAAALTRQLLTFSRKQPRAPEVLTVAGLLGNLDKMLRRIVGEDVVVTTRVGVDVGAVLGDVGQLEQVLTNLVVNARDAMPTGGRLAITADAIAIEGDQARGLGLAPGRYVQLTVADTGCGMDDGVRARIFEPFFTTKPVGKGTGLGLATVFGIVKQHDGAIAVSSAPGDGTTFHIYLPRIEATAELGSTTEPPAPAGTGSVLLVEDEDRVRAALVRQLEARGHRVMAASRADAALALLGHRASEVDVVVTDLVMPGMTGAELATEVTRRWPHLPLVVMSGYSDHALLERLDSRLQILAKPFTGDALADRVARALTRDDGLATRRLR